MIRCIKTMQTQMNTDWLFMFPAARMQSHCIRLYPILICAYLCSSVFRL